MLLARNNAVRDGGCSSWLKSEPAGRRKIFKKIEDSELTVRRDQLLCSSRDAGSDAKSDVLPLLAHVRANVRLNGDWFVRRRKWSGNVDL